MIVRSLDSARTKVVSGETWTSRRLLLAADGMGFSLHDTVIEAGTSTPMRYDHHLEAVYVYAGSGWIEEESTGLRHRLEPGTVYALDQHDPHVLIAETELRTVCVFRPALAGDETHDASGSYPPPAPHAGGPAVSADGGATTSTSESASTKTRS